MLAFQMLKYKICWLDSKLSYVNIELRGDRIVLRRKLVNDMKKTLIESFKCAFMCPSF